MMLLLLMLMMSLHDGLGWDVVESYIETGAGAIFEAFSKRSQKSSTRRRGEGDAVRIRCPWIKAS